MRPKKTTAAKKKSRKTLQSGTKDSASPNSCGACVSGPQPEPAGKNINPEVELVDTDKFVASGHVTHFDTDCVTHKLRHVSVGNIQRQQSHTDSSSDECWVDDDIDDEYDVEDDDVDRYRILLRLGSGSFGDVHKAYDTKHREYVAIKKMKFKQGVCKKSQRELTVLRLVKSHDSLSKYVVNLKDHFLKEDRLCLVFELLSETLRAGLGKARRYPIERTRLLGQQLCEALQFLSKPEVSIIHGDLKPENILFLGPDCNRVKLVDFGVSRFHRKETIYEGIQSRYYRAPEVTLRLASGHVVDVWSLGCILVEMLTGQRLFQGADKADQMRRIVALLGPPPKNVLDKARNAASYFDNLPDGSYVLLKTKSKRRPPMFRRRLDSILGIIKSGGQGHHDELVQFKDVVVRMLDYDPKTRMTACAALHHPFFAASV